MESGLLLNVVVGQGAAILKLLSSENQALLVWGDALLILDLRLHIVDGIRRLHLEGDGLASEGLDDCEKLLDYAIPQRSQDGRKLTNLHATTETENQVKGGFLLDVVVGQGAAVFKLLSGEDQALLVWGNALLVLNLRLNVVDSIRGLNLEGDGLPGDCEADVSNTRLCGYTIQKATYES